MAYKYTGRARTFNFGGRLYAHPDEYRKNPKAFDASYDSPITGMTKEVAERMVNQSNLHSFTDTSTGNDLFEQITDPNAGVSDIPMKVSK